MAEKAIVHQVPEEIKKQSIETMKVRPATLEYLRQNGFKTIGDIIPRQDELPKRLEVTSMLMLSSA